MPLNVIGVPIGDHLANQCVFIYDAIKMLFKTPEPEHFLKLK